MKSLFGCYSTVVACLHLWIIFVSLQVSLSNKNRLCSANPRRSLDLAQHRTASSAAVDLLFAKFAQLNSPSKCETRNLRRSVSDNSDKRFLSFKYLFCFHRVSASFHSHTQQPIGEEMYANFIKIRTTCKFRKNWCLCDYRRGVLCGNCLSFVLFFSIDDDLSWSTDYSAARLMSVLRLAIKTKPQSSPELTMLASY